MISSLFTGVSGMNANSDAMGVIGDNIANVNLWTDCSIVVGRLYDEAFVKRRNNGSSAGGFASAEFKPCNFLVSALTRFRCL